MKNDPWFNKQLFGSEEKPKKEDDNYGNYYTPGSQLNSSNNKFPTSWIIGGAVLLVAIGGLLTALIYKKQKNKKYDKSQFI